MMRNQRVSPDTLGLSNGRRSNSNSNWRTCKEDDGGSSSGDINGGRTTNPGFEVKGVVAARVIRSPSRTRDPDPEQIINSSSSHHLGSGVGGVVPNSPWQSEKNDHVNAIPITRNQTHESGSPSRNGGGGGGGSGDVLLQWGHRKRSRCSRTESRVVGVTTDDSSSSSSIQFQARQSSSSSVKVHRRSVAQPTPAPPPLTMVDKPWSATNTTDSTTTTTNAATHTMPPPPLPFSTNGRGRENLKPNRKNMEERSGGGDKSPLMMSNRAGAVSSISKGGKRSPSLAEKLNRKRSPASASGSGRDIIEKSNGCCSLVQAAAAVAAMNDMNHVVSPPPPPPPPPQSEKQAAGSCMNDDNNIAAATIAIMAGGTGVEKLNEWPRIYIPLSRKEKEEDFLKMKGTKLPHRPKKRPKAVDRILQYCYPGLWLSDLTRGRYEVREKKCAKKQKRRGLKGMESMDSESE